MLLKFIIILTTVADVVTAQSCAGVNVTGWVTNDGGKWLDGVYVKSDTCNERTSYTRADGQLLYFVPLSSEGPMWVFTTNSCGATTGILGKILDNSTYPYDAPMGKWKEYTPYIFLTTNMKVECTNDLSGVATTVATPVKLGASSVGYNISLLMASVVILGLLKM